MTAISIADLNNAKTDVDHISDVSTSVALTSTDRMGNVKDTVAGAVFKIGSFNNRNAWVTATSYAVKDLVSNAGTWYVCVVAHTSSAAFATDTATKWRIYQGVTTGDLSASSGSTLSGHLPAGASAIPTTLEKALNWNQVNVFRFMSAAQIADVRAYTYTLDVTTPFAVAVACLTVLGGGDLIAPSGGYLLNGSAGLDTYKNGILLPDTNGDFTTRKGIRLIGEGVGTIFRAGSANMVVVRHSRLYSGGENYKVDGNSLANVIGVAVAPESLTQTTELVSQSFAVYRNVKIESCTEGLLLQPGPTVLGSDSGGFYHRFYDLDFDLNTRHIWMKKDVTGALNRTTRTSFYGCTFTRGNTGVQIDGGTEIDFYSPMFEMISTGVTPSATPTAFNYNDSNPANINIFGGYAEACTKNVVSINPEQVHLYGFAHTGASDSSEAGMLCLRGGSLNVPRQVVGGNPPVCISGVNSGFAALVIDPDQTNSKKMNVVTNGVTNFGWFNGTTTHYGTLGNITFGPNGTGIDFTYASVCGIAQPAGGQMVNKSDQFYWRGATSGADVVRCATSGTLSLFPASDNAVVLGQTGFRWSAVWAANGTIQTSDPRTKKDIADSELGLDFILSLRPVQYKFKVGGNKIVGVREVTPAVMRWDEQTEQEVVEIEAVTENIVEPQPGKRQHFGFLTTEVKAALDKFGGVDFGGYVKVDPSDPESEEALRYDEFISPLVKAVQQQHALIESLLPLVKVVQEHQALIESLTSRVVTLESK